MSRDYELSVNTTSKEELEALSREVLELSFDIHQDDDLESRVRMANNSLMCGDSGPTFTHSHGAALAFISQLLWLRAQELDRLRPSYFKSDE